MQFSSIILAAGSGKRTGLKTNKVLYEIKGKTVLDYSIETFANHRSNSEIILVVSGNDHDFFINHYSDKVDKIVIGGAERQDSVFNALSEAKSDYVVIHDGARPFIPLNALDDISSNIESEKSITLGVMVKDTIQRVVGKRVVETLKRDELIHTQTPQAFHRALLIDAHKKASKSGFKGTDDTSLMEKFCDIKAFVVEGDYRNIKLTTLDDIKLLEVIL